MDEPAGAESPVPSIPAPTTAAAAAAQDDESLPPAEAIPEHASGPASAASNSTSNASADDEERPASDSKEPHLERPQLGTRQTSGTIIIPRDSPTVEVKNERYPADDARAMSPRRGSNEIEKMGDETRAALEAQAKELQANLLEIVDKVEEVKTEHEKLEGGNKFLQSYIGELMQTSKITSAGMGKAKGKGSRTNK